MFSKFHSVSKGPFVLPKGSFYMGVPTAFLPSYKKRFDDPHYMLKPSRASFAEEPLRNPHIIMTVSQQDKEDHLTLRFILTNLWDKSLTMAQCKSVAADLLEGLTYLHSAGIAHGKLNPGTIVISTEGTAKIQMVQGEGCSCPVGMRGYNQSVTYLAPEVLAGDTEIVKPPHDIWSVACLLCEIVAEAPFRGHTKEAVLHSINQMLAIPAQEKSVPAPPLLFWNSYSCGLFAPSGFQMLLDMFSLDPVKRLTAQKALQCDWFHLEFPQKEKFLLSDLHMKPSREKAKYWWLSSNINL